MTRFGLLSGAIHFGFAGLRINWPIGGGGRSAAIRELADRLDGKPAQVIDRRDVPTEELTDSDLQLIASGGSGWSRPKVLLRPSGTKAQDLTSDRLSVSVITRSEVKAVQQADH